MSQQANLNRVKDRIADLVLAFCHYRIDQGKSQFQLQELEDYVMSNEEYTTPGSAGRILRQLRLDGQVNYRVVNRRQSLYALE